jgi:trigger factor
MTSSTLTRLAPTQVALEFSIGADELAAAEDRAYRKLSKGVRLPGFRTGKVPRKIFEQTYGSEAVTSQAVEDVIPEVYAKAVREHDLDPVDRPKVEVIEESDGRPLRLKATVEVRPAIELGKYMGVSVARPPIEVTDDDVERSLAALAKEWATSRRSTTRGRSTGSPSRAAAPKGRASSSPRAASFRASSPASSG